MLLEFINKEGVPVQITVELTKVDCSYLTIESTNGIGIFNYETGKGWFQASCKSTMSIFKKGIPLVLKKNFLKELRKEVNQWMS